MSVVVIVRFQVTDPEAAVGWAEANASIPEEITTYGKSLGQIGHRMLTDGKDLVVIDEWPDKEAFDTFFANAPKMGEFLEGAGITGEPDVSVLDTLDVPGTFWLS